MTSFKAKPLHFYLLFGVAYLLLLFWQPDSGYDKYFWMTWSRDIALNGLGNIYLNPEVNYHPIILYLLKIYTWVYSQANIPEDAINGFKNIVVLFDFGTLVFLVWLLKRWGLNLLWVLLLLFNPAFWYNTLVWGQTDTVYTFFIFIALAALLNRDFLITCLMMVLAVNTKLQAVIFIPIFLYLAFGQKEQIGWGRVFLGAVMLQVLIFMPFIASGNLLLSLQAMANGSVNQFPVLSRNAYNIWYFFFSDPFNTPDAINLMAIPTKYLGLFFFAMAYAIIMWLFHQRWKTLKDSKNRFLLASTGLTLIVLCFFFFNTQMHERYVHSAILFSALVAMLSRKWMLLAIISLAYLLNLEAVMQFAPNILPIRQEYYAKFLIFNPAIISMLFLSAITVGFIQLIKFKPLEK